MALLAIAGTTVFGFIFGYIIMWLWNQLMPNIFGLPTINYWQGIGLFILARILLGSFGSDNSNKNHTKVAKKSSKATRDPDWIRYNTWWEKALQSLMLRVVALFMRSHFIQTPCLKKPSIEAAS